MSTELLEHEEGTENLPQAEHAVLTAKEPLRDATIRQQTVADPLQIPVEMLDKNRDLLVEFLDNELKLADGERQDMMRKIARWKVVYAAPAAEEPKHFPIWNASNITVPVVKEMVNTLAAQLVQSTMTARPRWVFKDLAAEWEPFVDEIESFMDIASDRDLEMDDAGIEGVIEAAKLGTAILTVENFVDIRSVYKYSTDGRKVWKSQQVAHDGPIVLPVPISRFWIRAHERHIQKARWCATQHDFNWWELKERSAQGKISGTVLEQLKRWKGRGTSDQVQATDDRLAQWEPLNWDPFELFWFWLLWDIDGDGNQEPIKVLYHREAKMIVSALFHPYWHGKRPFVKIGFFPRPGRFWDEGLCEMLEDLQMSISQKHNRRDDNATLANLKMILKRKMVKGLQPGDPLYTGKIIEVNDIWSDIREWQLAEIYPSTVSEEHLERQYAERLAGSNEATAGSAMPVTRTTASAQLALLQEQAKRIDVGVRSIRKGFNEVGQLSLHLYFQFGTNGKALAWLGERGRVVDGVFRLPRRAHELGLAMKATTPTSLQNRQVKRENSLQLLNLLIQIHEKLWPFAQALAPDSMAEVAHGMVHSARRFLEDTLETYDTSDPDELLAGLAVLEKVLPAPEDLGGMEAFGRRAESAAQLDKLTRLENLLLEAKESGRGGDGVRTERRNGSRLAPPPGLPGGGGPSFRYGGPPDNR